ncbi:unnamed protein product [Penicillium bialowiezense]
MTCDKSSSYDAWPKHVLGAATFLGYLHSANGLPQSPVAEIVDVCFTTALACLVSNALVPEFLLQLPDQFEPGLDTLENDKRSLALAMQLFNIIGPLVNAHNLGNHNALTTNQLVLFAIHSTDALHNWVNSLPTSWKYGKGRGSSYDSYKNVWFARIWNYYRLAHILANRIILDNLNTPSFPKLPNSEAFIYVARYLRRTSLHVKLRVCLFCLAAPFSKLVVHNKRSAIIVQNNGQVYSDDNMVDTCE